MNVTLRTLTVGCFLASLIVAGVMADPSAAEEVGLDFWNITANQEKLRTEQKIHLEMDSKDQLVVQRTLEKVAIANEVADGKLTFEEGMARYIELNRIHPPISLAVGSARELTPDRAAACQLVCYLRTIQKPGAAALAEEWECTLSLER